MAVGDNNLNMTSMSENLHLYYEKRLLETLEPRLVLFPLGKKQKLPKGLGKQVKWLRYSAVSGSQSTLSDGVPNLQETAVTTSNVTADVAQYGQFARISDFLSDTAIDPVLENVSERFGRAAAKTIESLIVTELDSGAAHQYVNNRANDQAIVAGDVLSTTECIEAMLRQKADYIEQHESGKYVVVLHPWAEFDLISATGAGSWQEIHKYTNNEPLMRGEIGSMFGMRFLVSDMMTTEADDGDAAVDVIHSYVIGSEAFGVVELGGSSISMIRKGLGSAGTADPLNQVQTVGYKIHGFVAKYLDSGSKRVINISSSSALGANT